ncbi:MAG: RDD family protein [Acetobacteraceae bacterium]|nr:RDD family protein [Acetobacteraceae bacterium]
MSYAAFDLDSPLYEGVLTRRVVAWMIDVVLIGILVWIAWLGVLLLGIITLGVGFILLAALPPFGFFYHVLFVAGWSATPGQMMMDLTVRRDGDLGAPSLLQAIVFTGGLWLTLSVAFPLLFIAPFTERKRALHDIVAGIVIVRNRALTLELPSWNMGVR